MKRKACPVCGGWGRLMQYDTKDFCSNCDGTGSVWVKESETFMEGKTTKPPTVNPSTPAGINFKDKSKVDSFLYLVCAIVGFFVAYKYFEISLIISIVIGLASGYFYKWVIVGAILIGILYFFSMF